MFSQPNELRLDNSSHTKSQMRNSLEELRRKKTSANLAYELSACIPRHNVTPGLPIVRITPPTDYTISPNT